VKGRHSYRESFDTLPNPVSYERIVPGHALSTQQLHTLEKLCDGLNIRAPKQWTVLAQRPCAARVRELVREQVVALEPLVARLRETEQGQALRERIERHVATWKALDKGDNPLQGLEHFLFELGSPAGFIAEAQAFDGLAERIQRNLAEIGRYQHLLEHPGLSEDATARLREALQRLGDVPDLARAEELDAWLKQVGAVYTDYKREYRQRHDRWWALLRDHAIWTWRAPPLAASPHLALGELLAGIDACCLEAARLRCRGLVNLDYQPLCRCGFDGEHAPLGQVLERFESGQKEVENQLRLFFQQDAVKARMQAWQRDGLEMSSGTIAYLQGERSYPEVRDIDLLDRYLAGADLVHELDVAVIDELLVSRVWQPADLIEAARAELDRFDGKRLRFRREATSGAIPEAVTLWCGEQAARFGVALPGGLGSRDLAKIRGSLRAEWFGEAALQRLEDLGLDEQSVDRVAAWLLDGHLPLPEPATRDTSILAAANELLRPSSPQTPEQLSKLSALLFQHHARFKRIARKRWMERLVQMIHADIGSMTALPDVLRNHEDAQWLLVDCLGLPLLNALGGVIENLLSGWRPPDKQFAMVSDRTTTDACYRTLLDAGINHPFAKLNVVDELIHSGLTPFADLTALAATELQIAIKATLARLDPARPLLLFADHGFRISHDGEAYTHGGSSTLERVVPVWFMACH
ncbi:MAG: hypothetical protein ACR2RB_12450, partial [Gammaproteobacteria bacterium]